MADSRAASRYVKSLLGLAVEQNVLEKVHEDMLLFAKTVDANPAFRTVLMSPVIKHDTKRTILEKLFKGKVHTITMSIFDIITRKNREPLLPAIAREFHNAYNEHKGISKAFITTAVPLDNKLRTEFEKMVKKYSDKKQVELIEKVDKDMIGGFILKIADQQIDASIRNKLNVLKVQFSQNPYVKEF